MSHSNPGSTTRGRRTPYSQAIRDSGGRASRASALIRPSRASRSTARDHTRQPRHASPRPIGGSSTYLSALQCKGPHLADHRRLFPAEYAKREPSHAGSISSTRLLCTGSLPAHLPRAGNYSGMRLP
ncbi:hypothetical protein BV25DRAFT_1818125 [Artomyces pyxidatus]|uniref:Uncharacterized protein n=1 Tax=Artomyces pyxidatus TaxID=48021 RepID=A0ACB8TL29_9AGAM|nr:hypothetical protein BV25DRAFT_1818125 [Artomyces pyxidatus]